MANKKKGVFYFLNRMGKNRSSNGYGNIFERFIDKIFANVAKKMQEKAIEKKCKKDPEFAKNYKTLEKLRAQVEEDLRKKGMTVSERAAQIARED